MSLAAGTKLGPYEIVGPLGAGGMGEVYRARDTRLDRVVAVKILPTHLCENPEFKQRFEREARTISSLNHPHICHLYDIGSQEGTDFLVMEFLDGETLAERLRKGAVPLNELLKVGIEVAEALEVAHRAGIVHRDLKPGNIMLTKSGAKLMDFGLAKPTLPGTAGTGSAPLLSAARTMSGPGPASPLTAAGSIVGTIQYMSPEQIEGKEADARSDIFAFGAVLYEMTTGKRAFQGKSQISVASAILERDPEPISASKPLTPAAFDFLVANCLAKDREERFQSAHDLGLQLKIIAKSAPSATATAPGQSQRMFGSRLLLAGAALLLVAAAVIFYFAQRANAPAFSVRSYIPPPPGSTFRAFGFDAGPVVISPDGKTLAFSAVDEKGKTNLWVRPLSAQGATMLPGTEDASAPFWSPDSQYVGFVADQELKKISTSGGEAQTLADDVRGSCCEWGPDGTILFRKPVAGPLWRVPSSGGEVSPATKLEKDETSHDGPSFLPDGKHFLYLSLSRSGPTQIKIGLLGKPAQSGVPVASGDWVRFASDHLLFVRGGHVLVQPFGLRTFKLSGDPEMLGEGSIFSVSANGVLAYHESSPRAELKIFDRSGNVVATPGPPAVYMDPRFSPDGKSIAVTVQDERSGKNDLWVYPVMTGPPTRITFGSNVFWAAWSPDGKELAYSVFDKSGFSIRRRSVDGQETEEVVYRSESGNGAVLDWSRDGKYLSLNATTQEEAGRYSLLILPLTGDRKPFRPPTNLQNSVGEYDGFFSPDSRWIAYFSYESGRPEVYVAPPATDGAKYQVSTAGGWLPRFSHTQEVFFVTMGNRLMAAHIANQANFHVESIRPLFQLDFPNFSDPLYDVSADGQRFVVITADRTKSASITLVTNWPAELKK
jgi:eukaryotic-like serine/threonine-protein kinase